MLLATESQRKNNIGGWQQLKRLQLNENEALPDQQLPWSKTSPHFKPPTND